MLLKIDPRLRHKSLWLSVGFGLLITIVYMSLTATPHIPMPGNTDKLYHAASYAVLMGWWLQLFPGRLVRLLLAALFIVMGAGIEVLQSFHPMRYFDVGDMLANSAGVIMAWSLSWTTFDQWLLWLENRIF